MVRMLGSEVPLRNARERTSAQHRAAVTVTGSACPMLRAGQETQCSASVGSASWQKRIGHPPCSSDVR